MARVAPIAVCWTIGFWTTNFSFGQAAVSFTHAVKATEPLFLVALSLMFFQGKYSGIVYASLLPIIVGICLVAMTELNFTAISLLSSCVSNVCFCLRSLFSKGLFKDKV